jgi:hypothetical protein
MADSNAKPAARTSAKIVREKLPPPKKKKGFLLTPHATGKRRSSAKLATSAHGAKRFARSGVFFALPPTLDVAA